MTATASRMLVPFQRPLLAAAVLGAPLSVLAHHAHDYAPPENAWQALASGLAHPFLSGPHLVALLVLGVLAAAPRAGTRALGAFCGGSVLTALAFAAGASGWPAHDFWVAASLALGAFWLWRTPGAQSPRGIATLAIVALAGSIHGQIAAESIETGSVLMLASYWAGIVMIQFALGGAVLAGLRSLGKTRENMTHLLRRAGAALSAGAALGVIFALT